MGYSFDKEIHVDSGDTSADFIYDLALSIVCKLKKQSRVQENEHNMDGIVTVATALQDCFSNKYWQETPITDYTKEFIPKFEKYIEDAEDPNKMEWEDENNKKQHLRAYRKVLENLKKMVQE